MAEPAQVDVQSPHGELRTAFYNPYEIKRRRRTSKSQFKILEKAFIENPKPNASTRRHLAQSLSMTPKGIQIWFQNRRAKNKQASNNNTMPTAITNNSNAINTTLDNILREVCSNVSHGDEATPPTAGLISASRHSGQLGSDYTLNDISSSSNVSALKLRDAMPKTSSPNEMNTALTASLDVPVDNPTDASSSWCHYSDWNDVPNSTALPLPHLPPPATLSIPPLQRSQTDVYEAAIWNF
ncbi:hypothetical protein BGZ50_000090 [Haplosporangium sp. Z 11]|nr:hypothetical protein BGZ50_000090 [Haplosporangium sp. Z 11]